MLSFSQNFTTEQEAPIIEAQKISAQNKVKGSLEKIQKRQVKAARDLKEDFTIIFLNFSEFLKTPK
jgi:hypothetical protein